MRHLEIFLQKVLIHTRLEEQSLCVIWEEAVGLRRLTSWFIVVVIPLLTGLGLSLLLELVFSIISKLCGNSSIDIRKSKL